MNEELEFKNEAGAKCGKSVQERVVMCDLFFEPVDICKALSATANQENADGNEHEIMHEACIYIDELRIRIKRLEEFNVGLANENHAMREMLSNVVAAYCGHFADVSVGNAMRRELAKIEEFLNT